MVVAVLADDILRAEVLSRRTSPETTFIWADSVRSLVMIEADVYMDLMFGFDPERIASLKRILPKPLLVNAVVNTLKDIRQPFIRLNAWPTMMKRDIVELAIAEPTQEAVIARLCGELQWKYQIVPDTTGMVTPRIVAMIINEAWYTLDDGTSSKQEIDTAMKLGTNYPFGPFEWGEKIGINNIRQLLVELARTDSRYTIAPSLMKEQ